MLSAANPRPVLAILLALLLMLISASESRAEVRFASAFGDHMVLQRGKALEVWGTADAGASVDVQFSDQRVQAVTAADGTWRVSLRAMPAGGPYQLTASSNANSATVGDVLIGDVWLCSGQSNMQMSLGECKDGPAVAAVQHPNLRLGKVGQAWTKLPQRVAKISWTPADAAGALKFSAVAYDFAHELENDPAMKDVPIGILESCLGGTVIESWLPGQAMADMDPGQLQSSMFGIGPTLLFNGMIAPLGHTAFTGVIWYQGEGNAGNPARYATLLPRLFKSWREQLGDPALPFLVVQLPDYASDWDGVYWQWIRESQAKATLQTPNTSYVVTLETNDGWDLHPQGKHEIGRRLSLLARQDVYKESIAGHGPVFKSARVDGSRMIIAFDADGDHLTAGAGPVAGFELAGSDGVYHIAEAVIDSDSVTATCAEVARPVTVRYAWAGVPRSTLRNSLGLPAAPFRTDDQPVSRGHGEVQHQPDGFVFKGKDYQLTLSNEGVVTSLIVRNQQMLSNAGGSCGGARVDTRTLSHLTRIRGDSIICENNETMLTIDFADDRMRWTITNKHAKDNANFHIALAPSVSATEDAREQILKRKKAAIRLSNIDRTMRYQDPAADDSAVLETTVPPGQSRTIEIAIGG